MNKLKRSLHWAHRIFWYSVAVLVITMAIAISLIRVFLPDVKVYRENIEHIASVFLGQEVHIRSMDARLSGMTPMIIFNDVRLMDDTGKHEIVHFSQARLGLDFWRSLSSRKIIPKSFSVYGVNLGITRRKDHTLVLQGLDMSHFEQQLNATTNDIDTESGDLARWLFERSSVSLKHSTIVWHDALRGNKTLRFDDVNFDIKNDGERHQFTGIISLPKAMGESLNFAIDFEGNILNPAQWHGQFYTRASSLNIAKWAIKPRTLHSSLAEGKLDVEMWGQWNAGRVTGITADINAQGFRLNVGSENKPIHIKKLSGLFDWHELTSGWQLKVENMRFQGRGETWPQTRMQIQYQSNEKNRINAYSSYLDIGDISSLLRETGLLNKKDENRLEKISPSGELSDTHVEYQPGKDLLPKFVISTEFNGLSLKAFQHFPGIKNLNGKIWADQQHGKLKFDGASPQVSIPTLFRKPISVTHLNGDMHWWHTYGAWHIRSTPLSISNSDVNSKVSVGLDLPDSGASPFLDLQADFTDGDGRQTWRYLPVTIMDKDLVQWLDSSIVKGKVTQGGVLYQGRLKDFPYRKNQGTFIVDFHLVDGFLDYQKGWPGISVREMEAHFTGKGMSINAPRAELFQSELNDASVTIQDYKLPVLKIHGKLDGRATDAVRYLVQSPIAPDANNLYQKSLIKGGVQGELAVSLALSKKAERLEPTSYHGYVDFNNASLHVGHDKPGLTGVFGKLNFSKKGIYSEKLRGQFGGHPVDLRAFTRQDDLHENIHVALDGVLDMDKLSKKYTLTEIEKRVTGKTSWHGELVIASNKKDPKHVQNVSLKVSSPLTGLGINLPEPLNKSSESEESFKLAMEFGKHDHIPLKVMLGHRVNADLLLNSSTGKQLKIQKGAIWFSDHTSELPQDNELSIHGSIPIFPLDDWDVVVKQLERDSAIKTRQDFLPPVVLDLDYIHVKTKKDTKEPKVQDPRKMTLVSGNIRKLEYDGISLGHLDFKTTRRKDGIHFSEIKLDNPDMQLKGEGSWFVRKGKQKTNLLLMIKSDNVGNLITRFGYKGVIRDAKAQAVLQLNWNDAPNRFSLAKLNGTLGTVISDGVITEVKPGAGRLLGLLSLSELPRHLALDFSEFREGMKFNQILGQFDIVDGNAFTENLHILSPFALIDINGRTGLAKRDYDLNVSIAPSVSKSLPVISWLAWGGQVGALTFLMDQLFGKDFNKSISSSYQITGSWEKPVIKEIPRPKQTPEESKP